MDKDELHETLMILKEELEKGNINFAPGLKVLESLTKVRYDANGKVDPNTVDSSVRVLANVVAGMRQKKKVETPPSGESQLRLSDFAFPKTKVDVEKIKRFHSEDQFTSLVVELFKEVGQISCVLSCADRLDEKKNSRKWKRNEAILGGLMVRTAKLQIALLDQICQKRAEIALILFRCLAETLINLIYLIDAKSEDLFNEYIEYSLREEKRLLIRINNNINGRGSELPIETRMKRSIERAFKASSFSPEQVNEKKWQPWGEKIYERAETIGMGGLYFGLCSLPAHAVHGNWQDLIRYHLKYEDGEFTPQIEWGYPRPQPLFVVALLSVRVNRLYVSEILPPCGDKDEINKLLDDISVRVTKADELHEQFLQNLKQ